LVTAQGDEAAYPGGVESPLSIEGRYAMDGRLAEPGTFVDRLTDALRNGARKLLTEAVEAAVEDFLADILILSREEDRQQLVRHRHLAEREVMTGSGPVAGRAPRVRNRVGETNLGCVSHRRSCHPRLRSLEV
jgi:putative transposase